MNRADRKRRIETLLRNRDWDGLAALREEPGRVMRALLGFLQDNDRGMRWRAVLALGAMAQSLRPEHPAQRELIRSLFWTMADESGNLCRMAPEALGEILRNRPELRGDYASLLPQYLLETPFETGTLWALCRLVDAGWRPEVNPAALYACLVSADPRRRLLAKRLQRSMARRCRATEEGRG
jgi:hypothetical protein